MGKEENRRILGKTAITIIAVCDTLTVCKDNVSALRINGYFGCDSAPQNAVYHCYRAIKFTKCSEHILVCIPLCTPRENARHGGWEKTSSGAEYQDPSLPLDERKTNQLRRQTYEERVFSRLSNSNTAREGIMADNNICKRLQSYVTACAGIKWRRIHEHRSIRGRLGYKSQTG